MSRITVVGASGYLGGQIALGLQKSGHEVIGVYRTEPAYFASKLKSLTGTLIGDVTDADFLKALSGLDSEYVIYLVSLNHHDCEKSYLESITVNVAPLVEFGRLLSQNREFKRLIYISTFQVYGRVVAGEEISERVSGSPANIYALTHQQCENALAFLKETKGLNSVSLRLSNGYGAPAFPGCDCWSLVLNDFCKSAVIDGNIQLKSDGSPQRDFLHIADITKAIDLICGSNNNLPLIMNLASGNTLTMLELAHLVSSVYEKDFNRKVPVFLPRGEESVLPKEPITRFRVLTESLSNAISFTPTVSLEQGVSEVLHFVNDNRCLFGPGHRWHCVKKFDCLGNLGRALK
jgi:nucleoside-diphosphate-sugar epimerase